MLWEKEIPTMEEFWLLISWVQGGFKGFQQPAGRITAARSQQPAFTAKHNALVIELFTDDQVYSLPGYSRLLIR